MSATYVVSRDTLIDVFLSGYKSAMATAVANRNAIASIEFVETDDDAMAFGQAASSHLQHDPESLDGVWRSILASLSGTDMPTIVINPKP